MRRLGPYELHGELARGAMGVVFRGHDPALDRPIALKVIRLEDLRDPESQQRFLREVRILARLRHPNVIAVHSAGLSDQGFPYVAMDLIEGGSLRDRLAREGPLELREAVRIGVQLAEALAYTHSRGVLHRDIKPHNVLLDGDDALLTDFGLAKLVGADAQGLTRSGDRLGTPVYMAPEQARGDNQGVGPATDVYSLGVTLFHMITGEVPFMAASAVELFEQIVDAPPPLLRDFRSEANSGLEAIIGRCLAKTPEMRFPSAAALRDALVAWQQAGERRAAPLAETACAEPSTTIQKAEPAAKGPWSLRAQGLALGAVVGLTLGLVGAAQVEQARRPDPKPKEDEPQPLSRDVRREELPEREQAAATRGVERFLRDDFAGALEDFNGLVASKPNCSFAWYWRARTHRALNQSREARADLDRAIEIAPEFAQAYSERAELRREDEPAGALTDCDRAIALEPLNPIFYRDRAALYDAQKREQQAQADVERSLKLDPRLAQSYYLKGAIERRTNGAEAALAAWDRALTFGPGEAEILNARGLLRSERGDLEGAAADYSAAIAALVEEPIYHYNRAKIFEAQEKATAALADLNTALEIDPEYAPAYMRRAAINRRFRRYRDAASDYERASVRFEEGDERRKVCATNSGKIRSALRRNAYRVVATELNVRAGPGTNYEPFASLQQATRVKVLSANNGWAKVNVKDAEGSPRDGYVSTGYLVLAID